MRPAHTITLQPWRSLSLGERVALEAATALLWPLQPDDRMTVLLNLMAAQINSVAENDDHIDAIIEVLRMQLKMSLPHDPPQDQHRV